MLSKKCKDCIHYAKREGPEWGPLQGLYGCDMLFSCIKENGNKFKSKEEVEAEEEWRRRMYRKAEKHS